MNCEKCGTENLDINKFCSNCGEKLKEVGERIETDVAKDTKVVSKFGFIKGLSMKQRIIIGLIVAIIATGGLYFSIVYNGKITKDTYNEVIAYMSDYENTRWKFIDGEDEIKKPSYYPESKKMMEARVVVAKAIAEEYYGKTDDIMKKNKNIKVKKTFEYIKKSIECWLSYLERADKWINSDFSNDTYSDSMDTYKKLMESYSKIAQSTVNNIKIKD